MGVGISSWRLARSVSQAGQLGVVSGTALDAVLARSLEDGDPGGHRRRALAEFPYPALVERVMKRYYRPNGRPPGKPYLSHPRLSLRQPRDYLDLAIAGNFTEVWLAREGHGGLVGVNFLEKLQMATPAAALGAMLAGVDYVLMGAGIPTEIPELLRCLADGRTGHLKIDVVGRSAPEIMELDPLAALEVDSLSLKKPQFLAIVSSHVLADYLARNEVTRPDGFVVEGPKAGGHNAPPRGKLQLDDDRQPIYGAKDDVDPAKMSALGLPFWLAGTYGSPERVAEARACGAQGVQVGTLFALSRDSGFTDRLRARLIQALGEGRLVVRTDAFASPTGFPFKVASLADTHSEQATYEARPRLCDLGYLRTPYQDDLGHIGYRCPSEPVRAYVRKGGAEEDTVGRKCLCNGLMTNVGLGQTRPDGYVEMPLVTLGSDLESAKQMLALHPGGWSGAEAVAWLLSMVDDRPAGLDADLNPVVNGVEPAVAVPVA